MGREADLLEYAYPSGNLGSRRCDAINPKRAFTLIEIIIALVLGTLLLATLMGVLRRSFLEIGNATRIDPSVARLGLLVEQFRRDIANARSMIVGNNRVELVGFGHRDPATLIATLRPARVIYEIRQDGMKSLLVRIQTEDSRDLPMSAGPFVEPVYIGAKEMVVSSNQVNAFSAAERFNRPSAVPSSVQIVVVDQSGQTILDHTFTRQRDAS